MYLSASLKKNEHFDKIQLLFQGLAIEQETVFNCHFNQYRAVNMNFKMSRIPIMIALRNRFRRLLEKRSNNTGI